MLLLSSFAIEAWAQQDSNKILLEIRRKVKTDTENVPRYLCTQTIERTVNISQSDFPKDEPCEKLLTSKKQSKRRLRLTDRLRLDVGYADGKEVYSWVGEGQFRDASLPDLVGSGATTNGTFVSFLHDIFLTNGTAFQFSGENDWNGRKALAYTFRVPLEYSNYVVENQNTKHISGYTGSFVADKETLNLVQLTVKTEPLANDLQMCEVTNSLTYTAINLNDKDFYLPSEVEMRIVYPDNEEDLNHTVFTGCHRFAGESKLTFDDPAMPDPGAKDSTVKPTSLPGGLAFSVALAESINPATAAAGDRVKGTLTGAIKHARSGTYIPAGASLNGRIIQIAINYGAFRYVQFGVQWESIEAGGTIRPIQAVASSAVAETVRRATVHTDQPALKKDFGKGEHISGHFVFTNIEKNFIIPAGFGSHWRTLNPVPLSQ